LENELDVVMEMVYKRREEVKDWIKASIEGGEWLVWS
jgi:hypothetical protein